MDKIIILATDPNVSHSITAFLRTAGVKSRLYRSRDEIYRMLLNFEPDIAILDHQIPGIQRSEILLFIRRLVRLNAIKVVVMTQSAEEFRVIQSADPEHQENYTFVKSPAELLEKLESMQ